MGSEEDWLALATILNTAGDINFNKRMGKTHFYRNKYGQIFPSRCYIDSGDNLRFSLDFSKGAKCTTDQRCICKINMCYKCPKGYFSEGGYRKTCKVCKF